MPHPFPTRYWLLSSWGSWAAASVVQFCVQIKYHFLGVPWYKKSQEALCEGPSQGEKVLCKAAACLFAHVRPLLVICIFKGEHKDLLLTYFLSGTLNFIFFHSSGCAQKYSKQHPVDLLVSEIPKMHFHLDLRKLQLTAILPLHLLFSSSSYSVEQRFLTLAAH